MDSSLMDLKVEPAGHHRGKPAFIPPWSKPTPRRSEKTLSRCANFQGPGPRRSEEHTSELQSRENLVCRLLLEKKKRAEDRVKNYSQGMRQRLGVARCLLADPLLLILDEPTNGLDPGGIQEFREMIRAMVEQEGRTVFLSSHLLDEVEKICDAAAIVDRGKIVTQGPIAELAEGGARNELILGVDDAELALSALGASELVREARPSDEGVRVVLTGDLNTAAQVNALLVGAGVGVTRLEPVRHSLEQRFLQITSRLDAADRPDEVPA